MLSVNVLPNLFVLRPRLLGRGRFSNPFLFAANVAFVVYNIGAWECMQGGIYGKSHTGKTYLAADAARRPVPYRTAVGGPV